MSQPCTNGCRLALSIRGPEQGVYVLESEQWLAKPLREVFPFFADASNLEAITPEWLNFRIITALPIEMRPGAIIDYRVSLHGIPVRWRTEIEEFAAPHRFVDRQVRGPYRLWRHEHFFREERGGTAICDRVSYSVPFGKSFIGRAAHNHFVRPDLERIFMHRRSVLARRFGEQLQNPPKSPDIANSRPQSVN